MLSLAALSLTALSSSLSHATRARGRPESSPLYPSLRRVPHILSPLWPSLYVYEPRLRTCYPGEVAHLDPPVDPRSEGDEITYDSWLLVDADGRLVARGTLDPHGEAHVDPPDEEPSG